MSCLELYEARLYRSAANCFRRMADASSPGVTAAAHLGAAHSLARESEILLLAAELALAIQMEYYPILINRLPGALGRGYAHFFHGWLLYIKGSLTEALDAFMLAAQELPASEAYHQIAQIGIAECNSGLQGRRSEPPDHLSGAEPEPLISAWASAFSLYSALPRSGSRPAASPIRTSHHPLDLPILAHAMDPYQQLGDSLPADPAWIGAPTVSLFLPVSADLGRDIGFFDPSVQFALRFDVADDPSAVEPEATDNDDPDSPEPETPGSGEKVVKLDSFRKKP